MFRRRIGKLAGLKNIILEENFQFETERDKICCAYIYIYIEDTKIRIK